MIDDGDDARTGPDSPGKGSATSGGAPDAPARAAETPGQGPRPGDGPDETRDVSSGRVCRYCGKALPVSSGRGNKSPYCQDGTTHGTKNLTCKQAWLTVENYRSLPGHDEQVLDDASVVGLGEHIDRALDPVEALRAALAAVRSDIDGAVTEALRDRDGAVQRARDADGRPAAAEQRAAAAEQTAADADEAADRAASAENQIATLTAERDSLNDQLAQLRADVDDERQRMAQAGREAQQKIDDIQLRLETEREQHTTALNQVRDDAQAQITQAREAAEAQVAQVREAAEGDIAAAREESNRKTSEYIEALGQLSERIGSLTERTTEAERGHQQAGP